MGELYESIWSGFAAAEARRAAMTQEQRDAEDAAEAAAAEIRRAEFEASPAGRKLAEQKQALEILQPAIDGLLEANRRLPVDVFLLKNNCRLGGSVAGFKCVASTYYEGMDDPTTEIGATEKEYIIVLNAGDWNEKILRAPR